MPCSDTRAEMALRLDAENRLSHFSYNKQSCQKPIGASKALRTLLLGQEAKTVLDITHHEVVHFVKPKDLEEEYLVLGEFEAVLNCLRLYFGLSGLSERYVIVAMHHDEEGLTIRQQTKPDSEAPRPKSCGTQTEATPELEPHILQKS